MAGHSHWAGIKYQKAVVDARRGKLFSKLARRIMSAARIGGADTEMNLELRYAIDDARAANMPKDNIERAIKKGTGELDGESFSEITYEGYAPGGVAVMVQALTDKRTRTVNELRKIFEVRGGNLGNTGCVAWMFAPKGVILVEAEDVEEDDLLAVALEAGADDFTLTGDVYEVTSDVSQFRALRQSLLGAGYTLRMAEVSQVPSQSVTVDEKDARAVLKLLAALEDNDDVQKVYSNFEVADEVMAVLEAEEDL
jgi:YebC/PmpR family DNA-binding regulatory protein